MKIGYQQANIAETLGIIRTEWLDAASSGFGEKQLAALYSELIENDYLVKSGQMDKEYLFQLFVLNMANSKSKAQQSMIAAPLNLLILQLLKRDLSRLALFLWINPLVSAISIALTASLYNASTLSAPASTA